MQAEAVELAKLIWQVRRLFQKLASESNELLVQFDLTVSQRAVLEFLDHNDAETLSNMARAHDVSRQNIQQLINELLRKGLVETVENPAHKRSFLVRRSKAGKLLFDKIRKIELKLFQSIISELNPQQVTRCNQTLDLFNQLLNSEKWQQQKQKLTGVK